jgi:hypothetical protein
MENGGKSITGNLKKYQFASYKSNTKEAALS